MAESYWDGNERRHQEQRGDNGKVSKGTFAYNIILSALLALGGWSLLSTVNRVDAIQEKQSISFQRHAKNDAEIASLKEGMSRIEAKLDKALDRK